VRTIRRKFFHLPGDIYLTPEAAIVWLEDFGGTGGVVARLGPV
jgi:hypothetical protein